MKLIIGVSEDYYERLKDKRYNRKATISDATILDGIPYEERPHGEWIKTISENGVTSAARCSECGFGDNRYMLFRYCPNCGADMRVKGEE